MTDFEIQRRLCQLNTPRQPRTDLWAAIGPRLDVNAATPIVQRRQHWLPLAAAASLLLAVVVGTLVFGLHQYTATRDIATTQPQARSSLDPRELARMRGGDPRLVGAAVVLDAAHAELEQALDQRPDAVFLVGLLNRTNARRLKLDRYGARAG